jgi:hypothetical protein
MTRWVIVLRSENMTSFEFALSMETCITNEVKNLFNDAPDELIPLIEIIYRIQKEYKRLIDTAIIIKIDSESFPDIDISIIGNDVDWKDLASIYGNTSDLAIEKLISFWKLYTLIEKSAQFYQQAALNSPHPAEKLFFASLAEIKHILRRRMKGILQIMYNHIWAEIGFAPIVIGKD